MARQMDIDKSVHDFQWTRNWHRLRNLSTFRDFVYPQWHGKPITMLEIGCFEAQSTVWCMQYLLTHPDSRMVSCDPWLQTTKLSSEFMEDVMYRAVHNIEPYRDRCQFVRGNSAEVLRRMIRKGYAGITKKSVDLCMIDGGHHALGVLDDCRLCLKFVKSGGWMLLDDVENDKDKGLDHVKGGLSMFLEESGDKVKRVFKYKYMEGYEVI